MVEPRHQRRNELGSTPFKTANVAAKRRTIFVHFWTSIFSGSSYIKRSPGSDPHILFHNGRRSEA